MHLAAVPDPEATWGQLLPPNVIGLYNVARAAADAGVRRLVLASSLHAVGAYPQGTQRRVDDPARPANLYGATKAWAEAIGSWIAAETSISVVALRIGWFLERRPTLEEASHVDLSCWLSIRDAAELVRAAVEAEGSTSSWRMASRRTVSVRRARADDGPDRLPADRRRIQRRLTGSAAGRHATCAAAP